MEDQKIVELFFERSEQAIEESANKYGALCRSISQNILHDPSEVEECLNDTYFKAWNAIPPAKPNHLGAYLAKIARNLSLNRLEHNNAEKRGAGAFEVALDEIENVVASAELEAFGEEDLSGLINRFLAGEKKEHRQMFLRRYFYFDTPAEIAKRFSMPENRAAVILYRMRVRLREFLRKEGVSI